MIGRALFPLLPGEEVFRRFFSAALAALDFALDEGLDSELPRLGEREREAGGGEESENSSMS